jgi:uncharacterized BrkB/YihY/UPF0761 family membrane protein
VPAARPALLALVSILGLLGTDTIRPLIDNLGSIAPGAARDILTGILEQLEGNQGRASIALIIGIAGFVLIGAGDAQSKAALDRLGRRLKAR